MNSSLSSPTGMNPWDPKGFFMCLRKREPVGLRPAWGENMWSFLGFDPCEVDFTSRVSSGLTTSELPGKHQGRRSWGSSHSVSHRLPSSPATGQWCGMPLEAQIQSDQNRENPPIGVQACLRKEGQHSPCQQKGSSNRFQQRSSQHRHLPPLDSPRHSCSLGLVHRRLPRIGQLALVHLGCTSSNVRIQTAP